MGRAKCGCMQWETKNGDTEEYICPAHSCEPTCYIGDIEGCKHFHIESEDEAWCNHPDLDQDIWQEYCPIIVWNTLEDQGLITLCYDCGRPVDEEDAVWINVRTMKASAPNMEWAAAYHVECCPAQHGEENDEQGTEEERT